MTTMASNVATSLKKLSHKAFRALLKKFRRKKKRQLLAQERERREKLEEEKKENAPNFQAKEEEKQRALKLWEEYQEREAVRKHKEWLNQEAIAQYEFQKKKLLKEYDLAKKEEERKKMLAELEEQNVIAVNQANRTRDEKAKKEEALQAALSGLPEKGDGPWHNPMAPENYRTDLEIQRDECHFFLKTGCCRFGDRCSRGHTYPTISCTLLIKGMYSHFSIGQSQRDDYDTDMGLEFEEREMYNHFKEFYEDVLPEFKTCGNVVQFKVCCNHEPHLRGNVYVQFSREEEAMNAYKTFNGRFYAGKQLSCEFTKVNKWRSAICGLFTSNRCPKGDNCNFLHVFRNPSGEFRAADRDLPERPNGRSRYHHHYHDSQQSWRSDRQQSSRSRTESSSRTREESYSREEGSERHSSHSKKRRYYVDSDGYEEEDRSYYRNTEDRYQSRHERRSHRSRSLSFDSQSEHESRGSSKSKKKKKKHRKSKKKRRSGSQEVNEDKRC